VSEWQPIETAPKNKAVLVWDGMEVDYATNAQPDSAEEWWEIVKDDDEPDEPDFIGYAKYLAQEPIGWVSYDPKTGDEIYMSPTHWQPLPPPPKPSEPEG
jgi:hypothetical protein